jgi:hypothetical protein
MAKNLTDKNFKDEIAQGITLVDFWAISSLKFLSVRFFAIFLFFKCSIIFCLCKYEKT